MSKIVELPKRRLSYRVPQAAEMIGVGKSKMWELIKEGRLEARRIDGSTVILHSELERFLSTTRRTGT